MASSFDRMGVVQASERRGCRRAQPWSRQNAYTHYCELLHKRRSPSQVVPFCTSCAASPRQSTNPTLLKIGQSQAIIQDGPSGKIETDCSGASRRCLTSSGKPKADRNHAAIKAPISRSSPHFGHGAFLNTILSGVKIISSCHVLPQSGHSNFRGRLETLGCITLFDDPRRKKVGFFAFSCYPVRSRSAFPFPAGLLHLFGSTPLVQSLPHES